MLLVPPLLGRDHRGAGVGRTVYQERLVRGAAAQLGRALAPHPALQQSVPLLSRDGFLRIECALGLLCPLCPSFRL